MGFGQGRPRCPIRCVFGLSCAVPKLVGTWLVGGELVSARGGGALALNSRLGSRLCLSLAPRWSIPGHEHASSVLGQVVASTPECVAKLFWSVRAQASAEFDSFAGSLVNEDSRSHQRHRMHSFSSATYQTADRLLQHIPPESRQTRQAANGRGRPRQRMATAGSTMGLHATRIDAGLEAQPTDDQRRLAELSECSPLGNRLKPGFAWVSRAIASSVLITSPKNIMKVLSALACSSSVKVAFSRVHRA